MRLQLNMRKERELNRSKRRRRKRILTTAPLLPASNNSSNPLPTYKFPSNPLKILPFNLQVLKRQNVLE